MALKIKEQNGKFKIEGPLNASTSTNLYQHFEGLLMVLQTVEIDLEEVSYIDNNGLVALYKLIKKAYVLNRTLELTGSVSKKLHNDLDFVLQAA